MLRIRTFDIPGGSVVSVDWDASCCDFHAAAAGVPLVNVPPAPGVGILSPRPAARVHSWHVRPPQDVIGYSFTNRRQGSFPIARGRLLHAHATGRPARRPRLDRAQGAQARISEGSAVPGAPVLTGPDRTGFVDQIRSSSARADAAAGRPRRCGRHRVGQVIDRQGSQVAATLPAPGAPSHRRRHPDASVSFLRRMVS